MLPFMTTNVKKERKSISKFGGVNHRTDRGDGELVDCINTSSRNYPALSNRQGRGEVKKTGVKLNGLGFKNSLYYTGTTADNPLDTKIYYDKKEALVTSADTKENANIHRNFAQQGDSVLIVPDNKVYNTTDNSVFTIKYEKSYTLESALNEVIEETGQEHLRNTTEHIGTITSNSIEARWMRSNTVEIYFMHFENIRVGDLLNISVDAFSYIDDETEEEFAEYLAKLKNGFDARVTKITTDKYETSKGEVERIVSLEFGHGMPEKVVSSDLYITGIKIQRKMVELDYICSLNNRVWGVHENTICCSKLGDCSQWCDFTADSYGTLPSSCFSTEVDTRGHFTAIVPYGGAIVAFKETCLHKIYGSDPESFTLSTLECNGVKNGCANTVATLRGAVYYMGVDGVYAYRGSMPSLVSKNLDLSGCEVVCGGTDGKNYYLVCRKNGKTSLYVYYPECNTWHIEQITETAELMASSGNNLYCSAGDEVISLVSENSNEKTSWSFSLEFDEEMYYTRSYGKLLVNYSLGKGGEFVIRSICDGNTHLTHISPESNHRENAYSAIPLPQIGCRDFRLEFEGKGDFTLKNITREYVITPEENSNII